ncbi:hypothetical protein FDP41_006317 [Naegleria fowleri]|uniref:Anaphase-promoting complex subunit 4 WD40 domain-containing protein n=1 Tax=Naegleria fowleri TaxID=5763 RepID=A0A6A5B9K7_NAEFO|nr:uncharacterized protein FDP41_006317 [Naegleria fowleri]KAF0974843.1 hypothetical protein FDP41_006317 [Naegleria fowleri]CAG4707975.1 unnamed protein product [Naegleria fowleri]
MSFVVIPPQSNVVLPSSSSSSVVTGSASSEGINSEHARPNVLFLGFNQDSSLIGYGTDRGFKIISCLYGHYKNEFDIKFIDGGIGFVGFMDGNRDLVALVGGGYRPAFNKNKIIFYNFKEKKVVNELLCARYVISVISRQDFFVAVSEEMIFTYDLQTRKQIHSWKTGFNTRGLCSVVYNQDQQQFLLVFPDESVGSVKFVRICSLSHKILDEKVINAHESSIRCFQLSYDGSLLATASEKGTLIRLFHTSSGEKKEEFRRGNTTSGIYSICFSHDNNYVACVSSNGTLHVFVVDLESWKNSRKITSNSWSDWFNNLYKAEASSVFKQRNIDGVAICSFDSNDESVILCTDKGVYMNLKFDWSCSSGTLNEEPVEHQMANID